MSKVIKFPKQSSAWEVTKNKKDLIREAEKCVEHLEENSVAYYFYAMLTELKNDK